MNRRRFLKNSIVGASVVWAGLPAAAWVGAGSRVSKRAGKNAQAVLSGLGLTGNLKLCLDAGAAASFDGTSQSWLDLSGTSAAFYRGTSSGVESSDPGFHGAAGGLSAGDYFSFDGSSGLLYSASNQTWMNNLHKNGARFTFLTWIYLGAVSPICTLVSTLTPAGGSNIGVNWSLGTTAARMRFLSAWPGGSIGFDSTALTIPANTWVMLALSVNENGGATGGRFYINGASETFNPNYTTPTTSDCDASMAIGMRAGTAVGSPLHAGSRIAVLCAWEGVNLSAAQLDSIFQATRGRFRA